MIYDLPFVQPNEYINYEVGKADFTIQAFLGERVDPDVGYLKFSYLQSAL